MIKGKYIILKTLVALILIGIVLIFSVSVAAFLQNKVDLVKSPTNKNIALPESGSIPLKFSSDNLISSVFPQGNISPYNYYYVNPLPLYKPDWQKQNFSLIVNLPSTAGSINFGIFDENATACCGGQPFLARTNFIY